MSQTADGQPEKYWYNLKTGQVEQGKLSAAVYRVGPFDTHAEASDAMKLLKEKADAWKNEEDSEN